MREIKRGAEGEMREDGYLGRKERMKWKWERAVCGYKEGRTGGKGEGMWKLGLGFV